MWEADHLIGPPRRFDSHLIIFILTNDIPDYTPARFGRIDECVPDKPGVHNNAHNAVLGRNNTGDRNKQPEVDMANKPVQVDNNDGDLSRC